jgi:hypothetical protein
VPPLIILILLGMTARAADWSFDGGILQEPLLEPGLGVPMADAGEPQNVAVGTEVRLDGTESTDPDGDRLAFAWSLMSPADSRAQLVNADSATASFIADVAGAYVVMLTVSDGQLVSPSVEVVITATQPVSDTPTPAPGPDSSVTTVADTTTTTVGPMSTTTVADATTTTVSDTTTTDTETTTTTVGPTSTTTVPEATTTTVSDTTTTAVIDTTTTSDTIPVTDP